MSRRRMGCAWMIVKPVLMLAVFFALVAVLAFPWTIPWPGRDTLSGEWVGELRSTSGPRAWLWVDLQIAGGEGGSLLAGRTSLDGDAALCTSRRRIELHVDGYTTRWSGEGIDLLLSPRVPAPPELRLEVVGTWDGRTLELREAGRSLAERLGEPDESGAIGTAVSSDWIAATMRRGAKSEFDSECGALAGRK
jgi:hypothetical protein